MSGKKAAGKMKEAVSKVIHNPMMKINIPAGMASSAPPLGTMLGQRGLNIENFVKDFNTTTSNFKTGIPLPTRVHVQPDRSYILEILKPPIPFLLKQAAGIKRASMEPGNKIAGVVSIKHVYEIAKFKSQDINCAHLDLKQLCISVLNSANRSGIKVVHQDLDPTELKEFLEERKKIEQQELDDIAERKAAKRMKAVANAAAASAAKKK